MNRFRYAPPLVPIMRALLAMGAGIFIAGPYIFDLSQLSLLTEFFTVLVLALMWIFWPGTRTSSPSASKPS